MLGMCLFGDSHRGERMRFPPADGAGLDEDARGAPGGCSEHLPAVYTPQACSPSSGEPAAAWGAAGAFSRQERAYGLVCASAVNVPAWVLQAAWVCTCPASSSKLGGAELGIRVTAPLAARGGVRGWDVWGLEMFQGKLGLAFYLTFHKHAAVCIAF